MGNNAHLRFSVGDAVNYALLFLLSLIMLYPLVYILSLSFSSPISVSQGLVKLYPIGWNLDAYKLVFDNPIILTAYVNTILYAALGTFFSLLLTTMIAYPLSVNTFFLKKQITLLLAVTMFFGGGLIPYYMTIRSLGMIDTVWVMVLPGAISAWNVIIYRTFFQQLPSDLREAAYVDGANDLKILFTVIVPLSKPLLATMALFSLVGIWNSYFDALIFLNDQNKYPLQMVLRQMVVEANFDNKETFQLMRKYQVNSNTIKAATIVVTMLPVMCVYPFLQKYFAKGVLLGSIKG